MCYFVLNAFRPAQVASCGPVQDVVPVTMMCDGLYVDGDLWELWRDSRDNPLFTEMWHFVNETIDDERCFFKVPGILCNVMPLLLSLLLFAFRPVSPSRVIAFVGLLGSPI